MGRSRNGGTGRGGVNWRINEMCRVTDEIPEEEGDYLIYGRTFELTQDGTVTSLTQELPETLQ